MENKIRNEASGPAPERALTIADAGADSKTIVVNGRRHPFVGEEIGRGELARLAFAALDVAADSALTVTYDDGPVGAPYGLLGNGRTTRVLDGQTFSVGICDKS